ncbi:MAG: cytochrome P450 [Janthinobacterium lividum]
MPSESYWDTEGHEPYTFYDAVREKGDVIWDDQMQAWLVVSAKAARTVMLDDSLFVQPYASMQAGDTYRALRLNNPRSFQFLTGEKHRAMHRWWVQDLLSPRWVATYRSTAVDPVVKQVLDDLEQQHGVDLVDEYAERIPIAVFAGLLGLPEQDWEALAPLKAANDRIADFASIANSLKLEATPSDRTIEIRDRAVAAAESLNHYLRPIVEARRDGRGDDFVSRLWAGGTQIWDDWNEIDTLDSCRRLLFAGSDTTTHAIANAFHMLLTDPALRARVTPINPGSVTSFVDEVLRLNGSIQFRPRRAMSDTELAGTRIAAGDMVLVVLQAANRDPAQFACPHAADLERTNIRNHLAFNLGPRTCPGANLARAELVAAITEGLRRFPSMRLAPDARAPRFEGFLMRSYRPLDVLLHG